MAKTLVQRRAATARRAVERGTRTEYLAFRMAEEIYAVPIANVKEILKLPPMTQVPRAPADVMGVISVRGRIVTVRDLRRRLRLFEAPLSRKSRILLAELSADQGGTGERVGLFVDEVLHVYRLSESEIESASSVLGNDMAEYVAGIGRQGGDMILLVDLRPILDGRPTNDDSGRSHDSAEKSSSAGSFLDRTTGGAFSYDGLSRDTMSKG